MPEMLRRLLEHLRWADSKALEALRRADPPPAQALETYGHVLGAEHVWLSRMRQEPAAVAVWPTLNLAECAHLAEENARELEIFLASLRPEDLEREVAYRNSAGLLLRSTFGDILLHVAMHGAYHRGQVALLLRQSGAEPEMTDYIAFVRDAPTSIRRV